MRGIFAFYVMSNYLVTESPYVCTHHLWLLTFVFIYAIYYTDNNNVLCNEK